MTEIVAEPLVREVKRYVCPFCRRGHSTRRNAQHHIDGCWRNPVTRSCLTCALFRPGDWSALNTCGAGLDFPSHPYREGDKTLATNCPKWEVIW